MRWFSGALWVFWLIFSVSTTLFGSDELKCPDGPSRIEVTQGNYSPVSGVVFTLNGFSGEMISRGSNLPACLVRVTQIEHGRISVTAPSLTNLFQKRLPKKTQHSIKSLKVEFKANRVVLSGNIQKAMPIPFQLEGPVSAEGEAIALHVQSIKAAKMPVKGFLKMIGADLTSILGQKSVPGISIQHEKIIFNVEAFGNIAGSVRSAIISDNDLVVEFEPRPSTRMANHSATK
jgi:hypothetical protein